MNELFSAGLGLFVGLAFASVVAPLLVLFIELATYKPFDYEEALRKAMRGEQND